MRFVRGMLVLATGSLVIVGACGPKLPDASQGSYPAGYGSPIPAGPPGGPGSSVGACAKDTDCKGDRVCDKGACVAPH